IGYAGFRLASGNHPPVVPKPLPAARVALDAANRHDLSQDEARGGHTLERHVGKSDNQLRQRLGSEEVLASSSYTKRKKAGETEGETAGKRRCFGSFFVYKSRDGGDGSGGCDSREQRQN